MRARSLCKLGIEGGRKAIACFGIVASSLGNFANGAAAQTPATPPASSPQPPATTTISVTAREVLLDVLVSDASGRPMTGLTASDFRVAEEGAPQSIKSLEEHRPMSAAETARLSSAPALPPNTFTNFLPAANTNASTVILLDSLDTPLLAQMSLREQLIAYLKTMTPGASIAIFQLDTQMRLIQGFSSDQEALLAAAKSKRDMPSLRQPIRGSEEEYRRAKREILREGMQSLGRYLAAYPGRKNLVWFTGEVPLTIFGAGLGNPFRDTFRVVGGDSDDFSDVADALTLSRVAVYPIDTRGLQTSPQYDVSEKRPSANGNMHFEARQAFDHMDLDEVAAATGGKAYYNTNGLKETLARIVDNGSYYYTLAYTTTNKDWNGEFRQIKVTVDRPGLTLQHRKGYYATNRSEQEQRQLAALERRRAKAKSKPQGDDAQPNAAQNQAQSQASASPADDAAGAKGVVIHHSPKGGIDAAMALGAVAPTEIILTASLAPSDQVAKAEKKAPLPANNFLRPQYEGKPFRDYTILVRAEAGGLKLTQTPDGVRHGTFESIAVVYDQSGEVVNALKSTASVDLSESDYQTLLRTGLPLRQEIAIPVKGNYFLRLGVHDVQSDQVGAIEIPVDQVQLGVAGQGLGTR